MECKWLYVYAYSSGQFDAVDQLAAVKHGYSNLEKTSLA